MLWRGGCSGVAAPLLARYLKLMSRQRRKDWHSVRKGACVWIAGGAKALPGRPLAPAIAPIRGSRR
jgi:hypothetical protein